MKATPTLIDRTMNMIKVWILFEPPNIVDHVQLSALTRHINVKVFELTGMLLLGLEACWRGDKKFQRK